MKGDQELQVACLRAYNDFLADFCSTDPARLLGVALLPTDDVEAAVAEVGRVAKMRELRGVMVPTYPRLKPLDNSICDPIWAAAQGRGFARAYPSHHWQQGRAFQ